MRAARFAFVAALLAGCGGSVRGPGTPGEEPGQDAETRTAAPDEDGVERGVASYYGSKLAGHKTANGERYDPDELTAAHKTLPFGTIVEVTRTDGRSVRVRINDRGPFVKGRVIDLSRSAAKAIGLLRDGVAEVTVRVVERPDGN